MSSQSVSSGSSGSRRSLTIILAVVGVIAIILGILWFAGAAPSFMDSGSHVKAAGGGHVYRGTAAVIVGLVLGGAAWFSRKK